MLTSHFNKWICSTLAYNMQSLKHNIISSVFSEKELKRVRNSTRPIHTQVRLCTTRVLLAASDAEMFENRKSIRANNS